MAVAIVLSAGSGKRMNSKIAKQYIMLRDKEVIYYSLRVFEDNPNITDIILVVREEDKEYCQNNIIEKYNFKKVTNICIGGMERYNSVYNGLQVISNPDEIVLIHDGARPFITDDMINESIAAAESYGACTLGVPVKDTIKIVDDNLFGIETPERKKVYQIQTPQTFKVGLIKEAYEKMLKNENHNITDDTMLVEQYNGVYSKIILGAYENIKITTPEDVEIAEKFVEKILKKY